MSYRGNYGNSGGNYYGRGRGRGFNRGGYGRGRGGYNRGRGNVQQRAGPRGGGGNVGRGGYNNQYNQQNYQQNYNRNYNQNYQQNYNQQNYSSQNYQRNNQQNYQQQNYQQQNYQQQNYQRNNQQNYSQNKSTQRTQSPQQAQPKQKKQQTQQKQSIKVNVSNKSVSTQNISELYSDDWEAAMIDDIQFRMEDLEYPSDNVDGIKSAIIKESKDFLEVCASLVVEICAFEGLLPPVITTNESKIGEFYKQIYDFVRKNGYPYKIIKGATKFHESKTERMNLINFLLSELQACKMIGPQEPKYDNNSNNNNNNNNININLNDNELEISKYLGYTCNVLGIQIRNDGVNTVKNIQQSIKMILNKIKIVNAEYITNPILKITEFNEHELGLLNDINNYFFKHYGVRKNTLETRMKVTIESMLESSKVMKDKQEIERGLQKRLNNINLSLNDNIQTNDDEKNPSNNNESSQYINIYCVFAAQNDLFRTDKITRLSNDMKSWIRKHQIPRVPDRGGRANEVRQVEIDSIPFSVYGKGRGGRGRSGGGRGGRGGYNSNRGRNQYSNNNRYQGGGGYQGNQGGGGGYNRYQGNTGGYQGNSGGYQGGGSRYDRYGGQRW